MEPRKDKYRLLLEHLPDAFACHQIITDDSGDAVDYIFLDVNAAFEKMTGLPRDKVIGRKVTEVLPGIEDSGFDWIGTYVRVALDGETATFEQYSEPLDCWYEVTAYSDEPGYFAVLFRDVTSSKKEKLALELLLKATQQSIQKTIGEIDYQHLTDALLQLSGAKFVAINTYEEKETKTVTRAISGIADSIRKASELIGFELTGKAWDVIPERINSIKDGRLLEFKNLYESGSGAISKQVAYLLEKVIGLGKVYVKEIAYHGQSVGDFIIFMPQGKTIQNQNLVEVFTNQAGATLLRNKAEQALKEKREQQEILLDNIETQIWFLKDVENYGSVNQAHADFFGVQKEELENKSLYDLTATREEAEICIAGNQEVFRQKHQIHSEELVLNGKGEKRLLSITKTPKLNDHNNVEYVVCSAEDITERKETEKKLELVLNEYETVFQGTQDAIFLVEVIDENTFRFIRNNQAHAQATGLSPEIIKGKTPQELLGEEPGESVAVNYRRCVSAAATISYEETLNLPGGLRIWHTTLSPVLEKNEVTHIVGSARDITEKKKAELGFISLVENSPDMVVRHDIDSRHFYVNSTVESELGISKDFLLGKTYYEVYRALRGEIDVNDPLYQQFEKMTQIIKEVAQTKEEKEAYNELFGKHLHGRIVPELDEKGQINSVLVVTRDITEQKQAEQALRESEEQLRAVFQAAENVAFIITDIDPHQPRILEFSPGAERIFGYEKKEVLNKPVNILHTSEDAQRFPDTMELLCKKEKGFSGETTLIRKSGEHFPGLFTTYPLFNAEGAMWATLGVTIDITERKQAEQKIADYTMELELKGVELEKLYQRLDQELEKARSIHERTLPKSNPEIEGLSVHAFYQPAQRMGGDFYNAIQVNNKLILYLSDVSGHGLEGALLSSFIKEAIESYASLKPDEIDPEKILCHLNRQYRRENYPEDYFVCIFLMVLDLNSMELAYTGAGFQELPLVQMGTGERLRLYTEGPPISSAVPEEIMDFTTGKIILTPGTTVLVNTDGITEQQSGEGHYNGRLEQLFYEHSHLAPELIMKAIKEDFCRFNGGSMQGEDDITLGIIQVEPEGTRKINL